MVTTAEAAARLGITQGRVRQICRGYRSPHKFGRKLGRDWFLTENDLKNISSKILRNFSENRQI